MFERFTNEARSVMVLAQDEARRLGHNYIGTEHLLLGLLSQGEGVARHALDHFAVTLDQVRAQVAAIIGEGNLRPEGHIPFTPRAKKILELSLREALALGHNFIGTEHILLGLLREGEGVAVQVLTQAGVPLQDCRDRVLDLVGGTGRRRRRGRERFSASAVAGISRVSPAAQAALQRARDACGDEPLGTHHLLQGLLQDADSMAAAVLQDFGLTRKQVREALAARMTAGTRDTTDAPAEQDDGEPPAGSAEPPKPAGSAGEPPDEGAG